MPDSSLLPPAVLTQRICLHVGCGSRDSAQLPPLFLGPEWREVRVDIDPAVEPDIVASITDLQMVASGAVDAIWSSHMLEHLYPHEVPVALGECCRVLKARGLVGIALPDLQQIAQLVAADHLEDVAYVSPAGPITPLDMLFGHRASLAAGRHYMAHHTGFTARSLANALTQAGFQNIRLERAEFELRAQAEKPLYPLVAGSSQTII